MRKFVRILAVLTALAIIGSVAFSLINLSTDVGASNPAEVPVVSRCDANSSNELIAYLSSAGELLNEGAEVSFNDDMASEEAAQAYQGLWVRHNELHYPGCAEPLHIAFDKAFAYEAKAYVALAQGGILSGLRYRYYHTVSSDNLYLIPFITRMIMPPPSIPEGWQMNA